MQQRPLEDEIDTPAYKVIEERHPDLLQDRLNEAYERGYDLTFFSVVPTASGSLTYVAIMELSVSEEEEEEEER